MEYADHLCTAASNTEKVGEVLLHISNGAGRSLSELSRDPSPFVLSRSPLPNPTRTPPLDLCGPVPEALYLACKTGSVDSVIALIAVGSDVDGRSEDGSTPLMAAAEAGNTDAVLALLSAGADPFAVDSHGQSAQSIAKQRSIAAAMIEAAVSSLKEVDTSSHK